MTSSPNKSLIVSPKTKVTPGKNLTGNPRLVRDLVATIHSSIQQWNTLYLNGLSHLKTITCLKNDKTYPEELKKPCEKLNTLCDEFDEIVKNLSEIVSQMKAIANLHKTQDNLFSTWPVEKFVATAVMIHESYKNEAKVKRVILENLAHDHRDAMKMLNLAAWVHQTQIPDDLSINLESMLIETKLR